MASRQSGTSSAASSGDETGTRRSPIPYRVGPLDYYPPVLCNCGRKAALWTSWSDENPGRRYYKCYRAREGGCPFLRWAEDPLSEFVTGLLFDLRNSVWALKLERAKLERERDNALVSVQEQAVNLRRHSDCDAVRESLEHEVIRLSTKLSKMEKERSLLFAACVAMAIVCVGMLVWRMRS